MLVLTRKIGERICIGDNIVVTLLRSDSKRASIGVEAPREIPVYRQEVFDFMQSQGFHGEAVEGKGPMASRRLQPRESGNTMGNTMGNMNTPHRGRNSQAASTQPQLNPRRAC